MSNLPDHLRPWKRFAAGMSIAMVAGLQEGESLIEGAQRQMLQSLYQAGCLRRPGTDEARLIQKHINMSRGQETI